MRRRQPTTSKTLRPYGSFRANALFDSLEPRQLLSSALYATQPMIFLGTTIHNPDGSYQIPIRFNVTEYYEQNLGYYLKEVLPQPTLTGNVILYDHQIPLASFPFTNKVNTAPPPFQQLITEGDHELTARFQPDPNTLTGVNNATTNITELHVGRPNSSLLVSYLKYSGTTGTFVAGLTPSSATGTVSFFETTPTGIHLPAQTATIANGAALATFDLSTPGLYTIEASYSGDDNTLAGSTTFMAQTYASSMNMFESSPTGTPGQNPIIESTISLSTGGLPNDSRFQPSPPAFSKDTPSTNTTVDWNIPPEQNFVPTLPSDSTIGSVINVLPTPSPPPPGAFPGSIKMLYGQTVQPGDQIPTGTINYYEGATLLATTTLDSTDSSSFTPTLGLGHHVITAQYLGNGVFLPTSQTIAFDIVPPQTTTTAHFAASSQTQTQLLYLNTTASLPDTKLIAGSYTIYEGAAKLATFNTAAEFFLALPLNSTVHILTVKYNGDGYYPPSQTDVTLSVPSTAPISIPPAAASAFPWPTTPTPDLPPQPGDLIFSAIAGENGNNIDLHAAFWPGSPIPHTGTITFYDGTLPIGTAAIQNSFADLIIYLNAAHHILSASYTGDATHPPQGKQFTFTTNGGLVNSSPNSLFLDGPAQTYVNRLYLTLLHRNADPAGLAFWSKQLIAATASPQEVAAALQNSTEALTTSITSLYSQILHRPVDNSGLTYWINFIQQGHTLEQLRTQLDASTEFSQNTTDASTWFNTLYLQLYNRPADPDGLNYWLHKLALGLSKTNIITALMLAPEATQLTTASLYQTYLHRNVDAAGLANWSTQLQKGASAQSITASLLASTEFCTTS